MPPPQDPQKELVNCIYSHKWGCNCTKKPMQPMKFNVKEFLGENWSIESDTTSKEIDVKDIKFETCLKDSEIYITGEEKLKRIQNPLGADMFMALWEEDGHKTLEGWYKKKKVKYIDFMGTILRDSYGYRFVLCLYRSDDGSWYWRFLWLGHGWNERNFSAALASSTQSSDAQTLPSEILSLERAIQICKAAGLVVTKTY